MFFIFKRNVSNEFEWVELITQGTTKNKAIVIVKYSFQRESRQGKKDTFYFKVCAHKFHQL